MSKSDPSEASRINLTDSEEEIRHKISRAKTDSILGITFDPESRPEVSNLVSIFASLADESEEEVAKEFGQKSTSEFKKTLSDIVVQTISPIGKEFLRWKSEKAAVDEILVRGAAAALEMATPVMKEIRQFIGI